MPSLSIFMLTCHLSTPAFSALRAAVEKALVE
jgi:hypothetical protein